MRPRSMLAIPAALLTLAAVAACGDKTPTATPEPDSSLPVVGGGDAKAALAGIAALAQDKAYAALYSLDDGEGGARDVVATLGGDGTWRVDVSRAMQGGTTDISIVSTAAGVFQCTVATAANPLTPTCVKVANPGKKVPKRYDPRVERLFRPALAIFTDRHSSLSVGEVEPLKGAKGSCYSVDSISASLPAPVDIGVYCYDSEGVLTAVRVGFGTLKLVSQVPGPATVPLPGAEVAAAPMTTASPPAPAATVPSAEASADA